MNTFTGADNEIGVYLVEDDAAMRRSVTRWLSLAGFAVQAYPQAEALLAALDGDLRGVVVSDVSMPGMSGLELRAELARLDPDLPVILFTGHGDIDMAVQAMRAGAYDFIEKPFDAERLLDTVRRACEKRRLVLENRSLREQVQDAGSLHARLVGVSTEISRLKRQIAQAATVDANVLIVGETGTGKEVVARCLHDLSGNSQGAYVALNCAAIPAALAESELFGHEAGAFTSAAQRRIGSLEQAAGGTLFLDELVSMPLDVQAKLLRAIQEREFTRLGSSRPRQARFRLIAAINLDPRQAIDSGRLREDLYYRCNTLEFRIPPLRERKADIPLLFSLFAEQAAEAYQREMVYPDGRLTAALLAHAWPGNVRELKNVATRFILSPLPLAERVGGLLPAAGEAILQVGLQEQVRAFERSLIEDALRRHKGSIKDAMEELQLPRRTLNEKMRRYGLLREAGAIDEPA